MQICVALLKDFVMLSHFYKYNPIQSPVLTSCIVFSSLLSICTPSNVNVALIFLGNQWTFLPFLGCGDPRIVIIKSLKTLALCHQSVMSFVLFML